MITTCEGRPLSGEEQAERDARVSGTKKTPPNYRHDLTVSDFNKLYVVEKSLKSLKYRLLWTSISLYTAALKRTRFPELFGFRVFLCTTLLRKPLVF